jgi:hypothetical protein
MTAFIENEVAMLRRRRETPTLLPRDDLIISAMDHQYRSRKICDGRQIVEVIAKQE